MKVVLNTHIHHLQPLPYHKTHRILRDIRFAAVVADKHRGITHHKTPKNIKFKTINIARLRYTHTKNYKIEAMTLAQNENLTIGIALNVVRKRYSIHEAKQRMRLKRRVKQGKSVDVYNLGRRLHGSYK